MVSNIVARSGAAFIAGWLILLWVTGARASTAEPEEEDDVAARADAFDLAPPPALADRLGHHAPLWIAMQATLGERAGARNIGGMLIVGLPLGHIAQSAGSEPSLKPAPRASSRDPATPEGPKPGVLDPKIAPAKADSRPPELPIPVVVSSAVARGAIEAALRRAHLTDPEARLDALVARAARAALLPELRLRVMRLVDEAQNQTPTEYDPNHATASGGTSLWLEARATWRLDKLVFGEEEIAVERIRAERVEAQERLAMRVLDLLFAWQKASALVENGLASPEEHLAAQLKVLETATTLDVLTEGWFARWRAREALRPDVRQRNGGEKSEPGR